ncbi:ABC transporter ATP-binding protein [Dissulfuribacter thermophilus]|uniref:ABC transporter ATP-binding protein n=1 Tax=Dissulfuribacter thermophilus TaxID=1156395 RepID=UPI002446616F|nr:ABC transporter ATP-binding protein [Dissulfuribacter thermophilus]
MVLKGLSCSFFQGEIISIMGASGVGKTTLIHLLSTLDRPTRGKVLLFGTDVSQLGSNELARLRNERLGFVFQMHHLLPEFSAIENACMPFLIQGASLKKVKEHAKKLFDLLDLSDRINSPVKLLSGGEQQRVAIIRAMVKQPDILFADEPTGNLDEAATDKVAELFSLINREFGTTIVFVTHNPRLSRIATRTFLLSKGVLEEFRDE